MNQSKDNRASDDFHISGRISDYKANAAKETSSVKDLSTTSVITFSRDELTKNSSGKVSQKKFINAINYIHFAEGCLFLNATHKRKDEELLIRVFPDPCQGSEVTCRFPEDFSYGIGDLLLKNLIIDDGRSVFCAPIEILNISDKAFQAKIKSKCYVFNDRQSRRFVSLMVDARIRQGDRSSEGRLEDFNPCGLRISLKECSLSDIDTSENIIIELYKENVIIFSGNCRIVRIDGKTNSIVVVPHEVQRRIYKKKKFRSPRINLVPTPKAIFTHPLSGKNVSYEISDITTTGFSAYDDTSRAVLIPGMIIHDVTILYAGGFKLKCDAQVIYSVKQKKKTHRFGMAIIDMDIVTYNKLFDIISNAKDIHANVSREVSMESLWEFFFETGFIYPKKYVSLSRYKEIFRKTYEILYHDCPEIFANFTYQHNGVIYGHVSIIRSYQNSWMIHHLAAKPMGRKRTGLYVLNHILNYFDGLYRLPSIGMKYMMFFFRPDNKFPDYFFGGFCREFNNPKGCSMDQFAYLIYLKRSAISLSDGWKIHKCTLEDVDDLDRWYDKTSGGLMMKSFCIKQDTSVNESLESVYSRVNLKRKYYLERLTYKEKTKAYFLIDHSDLGVNLSDLLNSIKVFVVDKEELSGEVLMQAVDSVARSYDTETVPLLIYPVAFADENGIKYEKKYNLWVLNSQCGDDYSENLKRKAKFSVSKFIIGYVVSKLIGKK